VRFPLSVRGADADHGRAEYTSPFDATAVELLLDAGAQIIGKANCDEFGMGYALSRDYHRMEQRAEQTSTQISQRQLYPWPRRESVSAHRRA